MDKSILAPAAVLVVWSLVMLFWMAGTRLPAMSKIGIDIGKAVGGRGTDIDPNAPPAVAWKSHYYARLMEQPTVNTVNIRFPLFLLSTICLTVLAVQALLATI